MIGGCSVTAKEGARVCTDHLHPVALQAEIMRLSSTQGSELERLIRTYGPIRRLLEAIADLERRAVPLKGANVEVVSKSRGHNVGDGIVVLGSETDIGYQPAMPSQGVSSFRDRGKLGAAISRVEACVNDVYKLSDTTTKTSKDSSIRCGARSCSKPNHRQPLDTRYCRFCGRDLKERETIDA